MVRNLEKCVRAFKKHREILFVYLFGSQARKQVTPLSDIDIGIFVDKEMIKGKKFPYGYEAHLASEIGPILKTEQIDLALLNDAPILLKHRCMTEGKLLYCRDEISHAMFRVKTLHEYLDTKFLLKKIKQIKKFLLPKESRRKFQR